MKLQICAVALSVIFVCSAAALSGGRMVEIGRISNARAGHTATLLPGGKVLIAGGMERNGVFFDSADIFDATTNTFRLVGDRMTMKRVSHAVAVLRDGRVLIAGGWANRTHPEASAEIFDPRTETFGAVAAMSIRRSGPSATPLPNGKIMIAGGNDGERNLAEVELFDPATGRFTRIAPMTSARVQHSATALLDQTILIAGGETGDGQVTASAEIFDPKTNRFTPLSRGMTAARYKHDAIRLGDGRVLIVGGSDARDWRGQYKSAEIFDPKTKTFSATADMHFARFKIDGAMVLLKDGRVLIGGGSDRAEIFDPKTNSFAVVPGEFGRPLHYASATGLGDGRALVVGGYGNGTPAEGPVATDRAWIFN